MQYSVINSSPMLYFGSSDFIYFIAKSLYPLYHCSLTFLQKPWKHGKFLNLAEMISKFVNRIAKPVIWIKIKNMISWMEDSNQIIAQESLRRIPIKKANATSLTGFQKNYVEKLLK